MVWVHKGKLVTSLAIKSWDDQDDYYTVVNIYHGDNGGIYFNYEHTHGDWCPIKNIHIRYCSNDVPCGRCPESNYFIELEDGEIVPVLKLKAY